MSALAWVAVWSMLCFSLGYLTAWALHGLAKHD